MAREPRATGQQPTVNAEVIVDAALESTTYRLPYTGDRSEAALVAVAVAVPSSSIIAS